MGSSESKNAAGATDVGELDKKIAKLRVALVSYPPGHRRRLMTLSNLALALSTRFNQLGNAEDLDEAIAYNRQALKLYPTSHPDRLNFLNNCADILSTRFIRLRNIEDLEEAITHVRAALALCPPGHSRHGASINNLALVLFTRFKQLGKVEDLVEAIEYYRDVLVLYPPGHPEHSTSLTNMALTLSARFEQLGAIKDLDQVITYLRQALVLCPLGHPAHATSIDSLSVSLSTRFQRLGKIEDLEELITCRRQAVGLCPPDHPDYAVSINNLALAHFARFSQLGKIEDVEEAIAYHRQALISYPSDHPGRPASICSLASALSARFKQLGNIEDVEEAIVYHHQALDLYPLDHPDHSVSIENLGNNLLARFNKLGKIEDMEAAIIYGHQALALFPSGHPRHAMSINHLACALFTRFNQLGKIEDLEEVIAYYHEALVLTPSGDPMRSTFLTNIAVALAAHFEQLGDVRDLEEAMTCLHQALVLRPPGHLDRPITITNLAHTLFTRFKQQGQVEDLEGAIAYYRQALTLYAEDNPHCATSLNNLANALHLHFGWQGDVHDLDEAITCHRQVLILIPPGHPKHSACLNNLATVLSTRFVKLQKLEDLEEAITHHHQALALEPPGHSGHPNSLRNYALALFDRFNCLRKIEDLEGAIKHLSEADVTLPAEHPLHAEIKNTLAFNYHIYHDLRPSSDHYLTMAFKLFESATNHPTGSLMARFMGAWHWSAIAQQRKHVSVVCAYSRAFTLLDQLLVTNPSVELQHKFLATSIPKSLASDAASSAIEAGQVETAVELLEQGRAILWSKMQDYRSPLEQLHHVNKELADQFEMLSIQLENHAMSSTYESMISPFASDRVVSFEVKMQVHRVLSEKWKAVVEKIQQIDGFANFLCAVPFTTLKAAASEGPVIVVNISHHRSDAIIIQDVGPPVLIPLPRNLPHMLSLLSTQIIDARSLDRANSSRQILQVLRDLWGLIVHPVTKQLAMLGVEKMSRIWWCPTAQLCTLPLHAAGPYLPNQQNLPDIYISSYTPTLSSLIKARSGVIHKLTIPSLLVVGQPGKDLPMIKNEILQIQTFGGFVDTLAGKEATPTTVLSGLQQHSWAHFACHGHQHAKPFQSLFLLHNDTHITILDFIKAQLPNAEFAFLSACHSAAGDRLGTPDEVIHLASALQFSGFRSVVGTLWAMADIDGPHIAKHFYSHMFRQPGNVADFRDSAAALNFATRQMRKRAGMTIDRWINFVHIGA